MLLDANILLYATDRTSPHHEPAARWLTDALNADLRVGIPWQTVGAFVRISTHPRAAREPLTTQQAWDVVDSWFASPVVWLPAAGPRTLAIWRDLSLRHHLGSAMTTDAQLAALSLEHGVPIVSADTDFARFPEVRWINPLSMG